MERQLDTAGLIAMSTNRPGPKGLMVFDWYKAARIIREREPDHVDAGLMGDWGMTSGAIWDHGAAVAAVDIFAHLGSTWAIPHMNIDGEDIECWVWQEDADGWGANTYWPADTLAFASSPRKANNDRQT